MSGGQDDGRATGPPLLVGRDQEVGLIAGYTAAKHGQLGLTKTAALDYGADGIRVNAIAAGLIDTPLVADRPLEVMAARIAMHALGRLAQASEIADAVVWLCSEKSSFVTGAAVSVDGGYTAR
jgi:NAD(P)-dependent dehydrogenase (short-subunit alcohol dehydrogenase family)